MADHSILEHEDLYFSETGLTPSDLEGIEFVGPPQNREAPRNLGIVRTTESIKAHYYIGTTWLKEGKLSISVLPKLNRNGVRIDFPKMLAMALEVDGRRESDYFSSCYGIELGKKGIDAGGLADDLLVLLVLHYISLLQRIVSSGGLRKGYVDVEENLIARIKGRIMVSRNIVVNDLNMRPDRVFCSYQIYTDDIPENRLLKKALLLAERITEHIASLRNDMDLRQRISKLKNSFSAVSSDVSEYTVKGIKSSKLFKGYGTAIKVAKMILRQESNGMDAGRGVLPPFWIDMTGLFELYVFSLLDAAYPGRILFQVPGTYGTRCDYVDKEAGLIIDAKYKPGYSFQEVEDAMKVYRQIDDIRELSGYARDKRLIRRMKGRDENSYMPPCVIIYPGPGKSYVESTDLISQSLRIGNFTEFYRLGIPLPVL